ncbi:MAG: ABC transporter ATP-binding protein [Fervidicoccaceae archaeon]|nr:ABC transporter ATP-binding protein [Fervidicoccaceae archaeon]
MSSGISEKPVVKLVDVYKKYKLGEAEFQALRGVNLEVKKGEFVAVMGPSGSGKTTLLNIMGLIDRPSSGKVFIDGLDTTKLSDFELAKIRNTKIGFVFQSFNLINRLTVYENIELPLLVRGLSKAERERLVISALLKVGGDISWLRKKPLQLSGGQQQRVAIARALVTNPSFILADEPTGNLDRASGKIVMSTFVGLNKQGQTIVMVTHDPEVAHCAQKILYIKDGRIIKVEEQVDFSKCILNTQS